MIVKHQEKYVNVNSVIKYLKQQLKKYDEKYRDTRKEEYDIRISSKGDNWRPAIKKREKSLVYYGMYKSIKKTIKHLKISKEV